MRVRKTNIDILNRVGIVFNFVAGFLIAPELIGIDRLKRWENAIESSLSSAIESLGGTRDQYSPAPTTPQEKMAWQLYSFGRIMAIAFLTIVALVLILFATIGPRAILLVLVITIYLLFVLLSIFAKYGEEASSEIEKIPITEDNLEAEIDKRVRLDQVPEVRLSGLLRKYHILFLIRFPFEAFIELLIFALVIVFLLPVYLGTLKGIEFLLGRLLKVLDGDERLQSAVVVSGIVLLILGNALQLAATF